MLGAISIFIVDTIQSAFSKNRRSPIGVLFILLFSGFLLIGIAVSLIEEYQRLADFVSILSDLDLSRDQSYADRNALRDSSLLLILERPVFGWDAIKYNRLDIVDNQYFGLALRYGFGGLLVIFFYFLFAFITHLQRMQLTREKVHLCLFYIIILAWLWTGSYLENVRLVVLIVMLLHTAGMETDNYGTVNSCNWEK